MTITKNHECLVGGTFKQSLLSYQYLINVFNDTYVLFWNARTHIFFEGVGNVMILLPD